jgi:alpha-glucosidase (family GH31 glycosyl hydrolase)
MIFWTQERLEGGREIHRNVDLQTMPLYIRAGSILPLGPVKQFTGEKVEQPLAVSIFPGGDASFLLYEDDGISFNYRKGECMGVQMDWHDVNRTLTLRLAAGSRMLPPLRRKLEVKLEPQARSVVFDGSPLRVSF